MQFHTLQSLQLWARIALPAEPLIYYLISKAFLITSTTFVVSWASSFTKQMYDWTKRTTPTDVRILTTYKPQPTTNDWLIKTKVWNVKIRFLLSY